MPTSSALTASTTGHIGEKAANPLHAVQTAQSYQMGRAALEAVVSDMEAEVTRLLEEAS